MADLTVQEGGCEPPYAQLGRILFRFIDRMEDLDERDTAERVLGEFLAAVRPVFDVWGEQLQKRARVASAPVDEVLRATLNQRDK